MPDTALAAAFIEAGYQNPLDAIAREAWYKWSSADAGGARRAFVKARLCKDLTWALIEQWQPQMLMQAIGWLLNRAKNEIEVERPIRGAGRPAGGGQICADTQSRLAPANPPRDAERSAGDGQRDSATHTRNAVTPSSPDRPRPKAVDGSESAMQPPISNSEAPAAPNLTALADKHAAASAARVRVTVRLSLLDTFKIDGQPIGDMTPNQARTWARNNSISVRFVALLTANLPPNDPIRKHRAPDDTDAIWKQAAKEMTSAPLETIHAA